MTIVSSMASQNWESADETAKAEYRRIVKEALRVRNEMYSESEPRKDLKLLGSGGYANVYSAKFNGKQYAVKNLRKTLRLEHKEAMSLIHKLKILREVSHPNIIKFYGVYKDPHTHNFMLVLQLANGGILRNYLEKKWEDVQCRLLVKGSPSYVESRYYLYPDEKIKRDEKSDIYSLGVVFWELTSGTPPFSGSSYRAIIIQISQGKKETIIPETPIDYAKLYMRCWDSEPEKRPT
ncbi:kinase-like domain-containing protein [Gigaspora margarita]|uniref:Kinase-like domain-containing protein n=1 Tax=Gigaspora margarita TaxID=4874 RepID=A0A8H4ADM8_GIGMA|nr:kinase-like domain-containing protein [Gigaspora margarita]